MGDEGLDSLKLKSRAYLNMYSDRRATLSKGYQIAECRWWVLQLQQQLAACLKVH